MNLVIATTTYFGKYFHVQDEDYRRKVWQMMVDSLAASRTAGHELTMLISDDASPVPPEVPALPFKVVLITRNKNVSYNANTVEVLNLAKDIAPFCLSVDSDGYFAPDWLEWLSDAVERFPGAAGWCLYNSPHHKCYAGFPEPQYQWKLNVQNHGVCYRTADRENSHPDTWIESFIPALRANGGNFLCPEVSLIQHCGKYGLNNKPEASEDYDRLFPYNHLCDLPSTIVEQAHAQ